MNQMVTQPRRQRMKENRAHSFKKRFIAALFAALFTIVIAAAVYLNGNDTEAGALAETYTVQKNDTIYSLSKKFDSSVETIKLLNSLKTTTITPGQKIMIPKVSPPTQHIVKKGETVYSIAKRYQINIADLVNENDIQNNHITIGQKLKLTVSNENTYVVKKNDTLHSIAKHFQITVDELKKMNGLQSNTIKIGEAISVPKGIQETEINTAPDKVPQAEMGISEFYTVTKGDTLWNISQRFGVPFSTIKSENQLVDENVLLGQKLFIHGEKQFESAKVIGTVDSDTVKFLVKGQPVVLKVAKGSATSFQKMVGQEGFITYKNESLIRFY
jgi:LysM repeat protein